MKSGFYGSITEKPVRGVFPIEYHNPDEKEDRRGYCANSSLFKVIAEPPVIKTTLEEYSVILNYFRPSKQREEHVQKIKRLRLLRTMHCNNEK